MTTIVLGRHKMDVDALLSAYNRLYDARLERDESKIYAPLGECLGWIGIIDGWWQSCYKGGKVAYVSLRDKDGNGRVIRGHRFTNNLTKHHEELTGLVDLRKGGATFPVVFPMVFFELIWKDFESLPRLPKKFADNEGEESYSKFMQGRPAHLTISECIQFLEYMETV
jgi:hypothetical protein